MLYSRQLLVSAQMAHFLPWQQREIINALFRLIDNPPRSNLRELSNTLVNNRYSWTILTTVLGHADKAMTDVLLLYRDVWQDNGIREVGNDAWLIQNDIVALFRHVRLLPHPVVPNVLQNRCKALTMELVRLRLRIESAGDSARRHRALQIPWWL